MVSQKLTGNDTFIARDLFMKGSEMREMTPMFELTLFVILFLLSDGDDATYRRIRVVPFESTFVDEDYPETFEEQVRVKRFQRIVNIHKSCQNLRNQWLYLLNWRKFHGDCANVQTRYCPQQTITNGSMTCTDNLRLNMLFDP